MTIIYIAILLLCDIMTLVIFIDVILSWLPLVGIRFRPRFISELLDPIYTGIKKYIPVTFGPFLFTPIILLLFIYFVRGLVFVADPTISQHYQSLLTAI